MSGKETMMLHSTLTSKGQTTIPGRVRDALKMKIGDQIEYELEGDHAVIRVHRGAAALAGSLKSSRGRNLSFAQIRAAAAANALRAFREQR